MKYLFLTVFLCLAIVTVNGQEVKNIADLDFIYHAIQKMPSYKDQLKNDKSYRQLYENLRKDLNTNDDFEVYKKLLQLIYPIRDNHLEFKRKAESIYKIQFIKPEADLHTLEKKYADFPKDSVEGIYYSYDGKNMIIHNGVLNDWAFRKDTIKNYVDLIAGDNKFEYKKLQEDIVYLRLSSFAGNTDNFKKAADFLNEAKLKINVKNIIVDVRNNGGGGDRTSNQFVSYLGSFKGKVYILQNGNTVSNAEQFIVRLMGEKHIKTLGETTHGTFTYGFEFGTTFTSPSNRFVFKPTDMKGTKKNLVFESIGIKPEVELNPYSKDWIEQVIDYINRTK